MDNHSFLQQLTREEEGSNADGLQRRSDGKGRTSLEPASRWLAEEPSSCYSPNATAPPRRHRTVPSSSRRAEFRGYNFALVICRHPVTKKFLAVNETKNRGWWIPGGGVDAGETFAQAAIRETMEEAGVDVELKGILKVEHKLYPPAGDDDDDGRHYYKMRVLFYAEPKDVNRCEPKSIADHDSLGAEWVTPQEFRQKKKIRGNELLEYASLVVKGKIYPLDVLDEGA